MEKTLVARWQDWAGTGLQHLLPERKAIADPQPYVCLEPRRRYRYDSRDSDFVREIEVDGDCFVTLYPGLFRRA